MSRTSRGVKLAVAAAPSESNRLHLQVGVCFHATSGGPDPVDGVADSNVGLHELERQAVASTDDWAPVHAYANKCAPRGAKPNGCFFIRLGNAFSCHFGTCPNTGFGGVGSA